MGEDNRLDEFESRVQASEKLLNLLKAERSRDRILFKMLSPYIFRFITHTLSIEVDEKTLSTINPLGIKGGLEAIQCKEILYKNGESVARFFTPL
jgi:hypothetical protein